MNNFSAFSRVVCISGGSSGIGAELVAQFLAAGDQVYTCGRNSEKLAQLAARWKKPYADGQLITQVGDVTDADFRAHFIATIAEQAGRLDVLVNNAGVILASGDLNESVTDWRMTLETNLIAPFALIQASIELLEQSSAPVVINLSSACAQQPFITCTSTSYSVSKAGLDMLTQRLARALGERGIRVNGVAPGVVHSEMWNGAQALMTETVTRRHILKQQIVMTKDVANAVLFLASSQAQLITGVTLNVDAGYTLG
ncbi:short-chain dehydrogenase [Chromatium weissei]|nr:short-chain dehydrogenase [Chromatium weissei]